jgi:hypothetical protein
MADAVPAPTTESAPASTPAPVAEPNAIPPLLSDFAPAPAPAPEPVPVAPLAEPVAEPVASGDPAAGTESVNEKEKPRRGRPRKKESEPEQAG